MDISAEEVDRLVGQRLRILRVARGITQQSLAKSIGVSFQQIQKYERGANRISAGRLWTIGRVLSVDVNEFFFGVDTPTEEHVGEERKLLETALVLHTINDDHVKERLIEMIHSCALRDTAQARERRAHRQ